MTQVLSGSPPPLGGLPPELARIILKLLEKQAASRYQSAHDVQVDLLNLNRDLDLGTAAPALVAGKRALAVLPFKLLTPNPDDEYLGVALADAIITQLSPEGGLLVRPTSTVMRYAKPGTDPLLAARELNVQVVVGGSIQKAGQRLRVHVQAWNAADGSALLSSKHDSEMAALFDLQDHLASAVAKALGSKPAEQTTTAAPPPKNAKAYEFFLRATERLGPAGRSLRADGGDLRAAGVMVSPGRAGHPPRAGPR